MSIRRISSFVAAIFFIAPVLYGQAKPSQVENELKNLRSVPTDKRPAATQKIAEEIRTLPAGQQKVELADSLVHLMTEGDAGNEVVQAVTDTLSAALKETPIPAKKDKVPMPYMDLAKVVRYEGATTTLDDPLYTKSVQTLADNEADIQKADFTLRDLKNKKVTLSELRGKIVMVNFWATWCGPCRNEMQELDTLQRYFEPQGLVILSITDEDGFKVSQFFASNKFAPDVVLDPGGKVHQQFHITGIPNTFLIGRDGKLLAVAIDQRTRRQFVAMLSKTDLHP
ncbi:MAG TPA: TlpA disulfide reductase family protein [Terracidiphilus sp.]|jgi:peroxiredoxin